jgi:molybdopterin-guanine dinucleotide biosynthesis protein A
MNSQPVMINRPEMLLIGAAGRNVGKTKFACMLIGRLAAIAPVVGVKITPIAELGGVCPREGKGCGVCTSLQEKYSIFEETDTEPSKDTSRMLKAGAQRVLWLRVLREHIREGMEALLERIPRGQAIVCESNTARVVVEPGIFLLIRKAGSTDEKPSVREVAHFADHVITFDGQGWDQSPTDFCFHHGSWVRSFDASAAILAGGQSRRMGHDKSLMIWEGKPFIAHIAEQIKPLFREVLVSSNDSERYRFLGLPVIADLLPGQGPLMGILSCLKAASHDCVFVTACDIPVIDASFLNEMFRLARDVDIVMPVSTGGRFEPLFAIYRKSVIPKAEKVLAQGGRKIIGILDGLRVNRPEMPSGWYHNLNTPEDYVAFNKNQRKLS